MNKYREYSPLKMLAGKLLEELKNEFDKPRRELNSSIDVTNLIIDSS